MPHPKPLNPEQSASAIAEYRNGATLTDLKRRYRRGQVFIYDLLRGAGLEIRDRRAGKVERDRRMRLYTDEQEREIVAEYDGGRGSVEIARRRGMPQQTVYKILRRQQATTRAHTGLYSCDHSAFDPPYSPDALYFAGLLHADGCIHPPRGKRDQSSICLALHATDRDIIDRFRAFLRADNPVIIRQYEAGGSFPSLNRRGMSRRAELLVTSDRLAASLAGLGVVPRKTRDGYPSDDAAASPDFWRGCVDGDGWLYWQMHGRPNSRKRRPAIGLCGNAQTIESFIYFARQLVPTTAKPRTLNQNPDSPYKKVEFGGSFAAVLIRALYGRGGPALNRKAKIAAEVMAHPRWMSAADACQA